MHTILLIDVNGYIRSWILLSCVTIWFRKNRIKLIDLHVLKRLMIHYLLY